MLVQTKGNEHGFAAAEGWVEVVYKEEESAGVYLWHQVLSFFGE
jgi:hypothetical protein